MAYRFKRRLTPEQMAEHVARAEAQRRHDAEMKSVRDRERTDCYRNDFLQRALNLGVLARDLYSVVASADVIDSRRVSEELERLEASLARQVERIAEEGGLVARE
jgi:hypothetical protein